MNKKSLTLALLAAMSVHAGFATCGVCTNVKALAQKSINNAMAHKYILAAATVVAVGAVVYKSDYLLKKLRTLLGKETKVKRSVRPVPYRGLKDICPCECEDEDVCEAKVRSCDDDECGYETEETE